VHTTSSLNKSQDRYHFLNLRRLPARLTAEEAGWLLGFAPEELAILTPKGLLTPLGKPVQNARKWHAATTILALANDQAWLNKATNMIALHWRARNTKHNPSC